MSKSRNFTLGCVLGAVLTVGLLVCSGVVGLFALGYVIYQDEVCEYLGAQPAVVEAVGDVESCEFLVLESGEIADPDTFVFRVEGDAAQGRAYVQSTSTGPDGAEEYQGIMLVVGGRRVLVEGREPPTE